MTILPLELVVDEDWEVGWPVIGSGEPGGKSGVSDVVDTLPTGKDLVPGGGVSGSGDEEWPWSWPCSWNKNNPTMFDANPNDPTMTTSFGLPTSGTLKNLSIASMNIEKQSASKKTPLINAARISARCQPYEYSGEATFLASLMA